MKVFKFGGASVKSAEAVKNMAGIVKNHSTDELVVVVSAMGKSTNKLELILQNQINKTDNYKNLTELRRFHENICEELFENSKSVKSRIETYFDDLIRILKSDYTVNQLYDQVISFGELLSTLIISKYLEAIEVKNTLVDSREYIKTNDTFRNAQVNWTITENKIRPLKEEIKNQLVLTQGFLGSTSGGLTTTLGREGSDFTAAIFAHCLNAESVTVWKDVPGILNADPKLINNTQLYDEIPYKEAAEMTYYGASVIHPKTIKPLANKGIPLYVRSFDIPEGAGTIIHQCNFTDPISSIIIKKDQCLVSFHVLDYTFVNEENLSVIFKELAALDIKINIMQNSAISFSIVIDHDVDKLDRLIERMSNQFDIKYNTHLTLITIKNYQKEEIDQYRKGKNILLEQTSRNNYRALYAT